MSTRRPVLYALRVLTASFAVFAAGTGVAIVGALSRATAATYVGIWILTPAALVVVTALGTTAVLDRKTRTGN